MIREFKKFGEIDYILSRPDDDSPDRTYPLIVYLHGAGSRGRDLNIVLEGHFFTLAEQLMPAAISVAPQCYADTWFDIFEQLTRFTAYALEQRNVDRTRCYLMGVSMGGYAAWQLAMSHPEWFAAAIPICGGGMHWNAGRLRDVAVWAFHGMEDTVVFPEESERMVEAVRRAGGDARLTLYPGVAHDSWMRVYQSREVFDWLFAQKKSDPGTMITEGEKSDPRNYG